MLYTAQAMIDAMRAAFDDAAHDAEHQLLFLNLHDDRPAAPAVRGRQRLHGALPRLGEGGPMTANTADLSRWWTRRNRRHRLQAAARRRSHGFPVSPHGDAASAG